MALPPTPPTVLQAGAAHPTLGQLLAIERASRQRLNCVRPLLPPALRDCVAAGSLKDGQWCLVLANSAVRAKLRQLLPALLAHLRSHNLAVEGITLRVRRDV